MILKDKTVLFLGSSVTEGETAGGISFADLMVEQCGIKMIKEAVSGTTLADINETSYVARLKKIDKSKHIDLFICQLSTNDSGLGIELIKIEEAIRFILTYVKSTFLCPIIFYTGTRFERESYGDMVKLLISLQDEYDFHILNLWDDEEMLSVSDEDYSRFMYDPVHPTITGYREWWTPKFIEFCDSLSE